MWGHSGTGRALVAGGAGASSSRQSRAGASPGSTGEEGGSGGGRRKEGEGSEEEGDTGDDSGASPPKNEQPAVVVVKACDEGDRKGGSCDKMEGYYQPAHPNHLGHGGGGVHQPLVRGGGYPGGPLEEGEVRRRGGPGTAASTRDGVVIIERRPSQEGIQPAEMQVLMSPEILIATNLDLDLDLDSTNSWRTNSCSVTILSKIGDFCFMFLL